MPRGTVRSMLAVFRVKLPIDLQSHRSRAKGFHKRADMLSRHDFNGAKWLGRFRLYLDSQFLGDGGPKRPVPLAELLVEILARVPFPERIQPARPSRGQPGVDQPWDSLKGG